MTELYAGIWICGFEDLGKLKVIGTNLFLLSCEPIPNFHKCIRLLH